MRERLLLVVFTTVCATAQGQMVPASVSATKVKLDSIQSIMPSDTLNHAVSGAFSAYDSLYQYVNSRRRSDSLAIDGWARGLKARISSRYSDSAIHRIRENMLTRNIALPRINQYTDSISAHKDSLTNLVTTGQRTLQKGINARYSSWIDKTKGSLPPDSISEMLGSRSRFEQNTPAENAVLPDFGSSNLPKSGGIPELPALAPADFEELNLSAELIDIGGEETIPSSDQLKQWGTLPQLPGINTPLPELSAVTDDPERTALRAAENVEEIKAASEAMKAAEGVSQPISNEQMQALGDPSLLKEQVQATAMDNLNSRQAEVNGMMLQVSKYKRKYASIGSLAEIKKNDWLPRNGLKDRPFRERFRLGMNTGFRSAGDTLLVDLYPNASYRITGRLEAGFALMYQLRISTTPILLNQSHPVWGISTFAVVKAIKSLGLRAELEGDSWPRFTSQSEPVKRDWRWRFFAGFQSSFKLGKQWTGLAQMLYGFDASLKDAFPEGLRARVGVQYQLPRKR